METLFYLLENLYRIAGIPIRCLDPSGKLVLFSRGYKHDFDPFNHPKIKAKILHLFSENRTPFIEVEEDMYSYGCIKDTTDCLAVVGPIIASAQKPIDVEKYANNLGIPFDHFYVSSKGVQELVSAMSILYFSRYGKTLNEEKLHIDKATHVEHERERYVFEKSDHEIRRHSYNIERKFLAQVREGDVFGIENQSIDYDAEKLVGKVAKKPLKRFEYTVCTSICLASRAAIEGGLEPSLAYDVSDIFLQRLEQCKGVSEMLSLHSEMKLYFAKQVKAAQLARSKASYVEKCKVYVNQNLNIVFSLDDVANSININKRYLSRKFSQETGETIMEYTRRKRVQAAANMLKYSDEKISSIATYLTFPDQSHFGKVFKDVMGTTPKQYRNANQTIEV